MVSASPVRLLPHLSPFAERGGDAVRLGVFGCVDYQRVAAWRVVVTTRESDSSRCFRADLSRLGIGGSWGCCDQAPAPIERSAASESRPSAKHSDWRERRVSILAQVESHWPAATELIVRPDPIIG